MQAARESIVLLKNGNNTLPLKASIRKIAVVGPTADLLESIEGNYNGTAPDPVSPLNGLRKEFGGENVIYAPGSTLADGAPAPVPSAYLRTDASLKTAGLKGEYFDTEDMKGAPKMVRVDAQINFDWNRVIPAQRIFPTKHICSALDGRIAATTPGDYVLSYAAGRASIAASVMTGEVVQRHKLPPAKIAGSGSGFYVDEKLV